MRLLEDILAEEMLSGRLKDGDTSIVDMGEDGKAILTPKDQDKLPAAAPDLLAPVGE
jgi:ATP-dependent Clp protease ATP-binding subunit ClpC